MALLALACGVGLVGFAVIMIARAILRTLFQVVGHLGASAAYHGARVIAGDEFAKKNEADLRRLGMVAGAIGAIVLAGGAIDLDGFDGESLDADAAALPSGIDLNGDGLVDGFDTDADGVLDTNVLGVSGYARADGTYVDSYVRTTADGSTLNNLRPHA